MFIANNLMQLFLIRRLRKRYETQREIVRLLLKGLYLLKYKSELVFNTYRKKISEYLLIDFGRGIICPEFRNAR